MSHRAATNSNGFSRSRPLRFASLFRRVHPYEWIVAISLIAAHILFAVTKTPVPPSWILYSLVLLAPSFLGMLLGGVVLRLLFSIFTRSTLRYLRQTWSVEWMVETVRIAVSFVLLIHVYGWMKVMLPLTNPRTFDQALWQVDRLLLFGMSPNVLFLNLFPPPVLSFIDQFYELAFVLLLNLGIMLGLTHASTRYRVAFCTASAVLWSGGAWLYTLIPSLGPAYAFPDVWAESWRHLSTSRLGQYHLWKNYELVIRMKGGLGASNVNFFFGVAAFPSLHVAWEAMLALWARVTGRPFAVLLFAFTLFTLLGSVVTGWHYLIDGIAGFALAAIACAVGMRVCRLARWARLNRVLRGSAISI